MNRELQKLLLEQKKEESYHTSLEEEFGFYRRIAKGDLSVLEGDMEEPLQGQGILSENPLRNHKYHLIILTAMITRFCIEEGLESEMAYTMSDLFIREIDRVASERKLPELKYKIISQFLQIMKTEKRRGYSFAVTKAMEYIENHLTEPLSNVQIAESLSCTPDYLSRLFKKETGRTLAKYVLEQKCHTACYMLENSNSSCTDISVFLGFASCSHFTGRFRNLYGITPGEYRKQHKRKTINSFGDLHKL